MSAMSKYQGLRICLRATISYEMMMILIQKRYNFTSPLFVLCAVILLCLEDAIRTIVAFKTIHRLCAVSALNMHTNNQAGTHCFKLLGYLLQFSLCQTIPQPVYKAPTKALLRSSTPYRTLYLQNHLPSNSISPKSINNSEPQHSNQYVLYPLPQYQPLRPPQHLQLPAPTLYAHPQRR